MNTIPKERLEGIPLNLGQLSNLTHRFRWQRSVVWVGMTSTFSNLSELICQECVEGIFFKFATTIHSIITFLDFVLTFDLEGFKLTVTSCMAHSCQCYIREMPGRNFNISATHICLD